MAPLPDVAHVVRCRLFFNIGTKDAQGLRFFVSYPGAAPDVPQINSMTATLYASAAATLPAVMHPDNAFAGAKCEDLSAAMGVVGEVLGTTAGSEAGGPLGASAAFVTSYIIPVRYRGGHPRTYWPFGTDTDVNNPQGWKSGSVGAFLSAAETVIDSVVSNVFGGWSTGPQCAVSYYDGFTNITNPITGRARAVPTLRPTPVVYTVGSVVGQSYIASARRRRLKVS